MDAPDHEDTVMIMEFPNRAFGVELRRRRSAAGLSLDALAGAVHYSKGHLSKVENGLKNPGPELARLCDAALGGDGTLASLAAGGRAARVRRVDRGEPEVQVFDMDPGRLRFVLATRRELFAAGPLSGAGLTEPPDRVNQPGHAGPPELTVFRRWYSEARNLGQTMDARLLLPVLTAHAHTLSVLAGERRGADREAVLALVADYAEYTGWMAQEAGDDQLALWWTGQAVRFASAAGDREMAGYALVRRALIAMYRGDTDDTVALARSAQRSGYRPRIRGLAAQREAQGHALAHRRSACLHALDRARDLLAGDPPHQREPVIGSAHIPDVVEAATGWSLYDLGDAAESARLLGGVVGRTAAPAVRARTRFNARRALALAASGQWDDAGTVAGRVLEEQATLRSATIATDLRRLGTLLGRRRADPAAARLALRLHAAAQHD